MDSHLQSDVIEQLERDIALPERVRDLVLAAVLGEVEECLGGKTPTRPAETAAEAPDPVRAYVESIAVEGFRGIGPPTAQELSLWADTVERLMAATKKPDAD